MGILAGRNYKYSIGVIEVLVIGYKVSVIGPRG